MRRCQLFLGNAAFDGLDEVGTEILRRDNVVQCSYFQGAMHAMDSVEFRRHLSHLFGMHDFKEFVPLGAQAILLRSFGQRERSSLIYLAECASLMLGTPHRNCQKGGWTLTPETRTVWESGTEC